MMTRAFEVIAEQQIHQEDFGEGKCYSETHSNRKFLSFTRFLIHNACHMPKELWSSQFVADINPSVSSDLRGGFLKIVLKVYWALLKSQERLR